MRFMDRFVRSLAVSAAFLLNGGLLAQKVSTKTTVYNEIFLTDSGLIPLPENAIELERVFTIRSEYFQSPLKLVIDSNGNLCVSSSKNNVVSVFDPAGRFLFLWGGEKAAKSLFRNPFDLAAAKDFLIVHEMDRGRLHFVDDRGNSLRRREVSGFHDIDSDADGRLYMAPLVKDRDSPLVQIDPPAGTSRSFGKPLIFTHSMSALNSRSLTVNEKGEIFVAFTYFPIVRKYSPDGTLSGEFRIAGPVFEAKEKFNLKIIGEGIADSAARGGCKELITGIEAHAGKIYVLSHFPRLEIAELDENGNGLTTYWMDFQEIYAADDFAVADVDGERRFFVSHPFQPKYEIDVFRKTEKKFSDGLPGAIEKLTIEIETYPDHYLAYHNRGVARHQSGDYQGAIEDLSKAIELAPDSALVYHNRGLARIKAKEFDGAVDDFSKALTLAPSAKAFFDRGIARAHLGDFERAIGDFERAAMLDPGFKSKASEQIEYCRKRLKTVKK